MPKGYTPALLELSQHLLLIFVVRIPVRNELVNVTLVLFCAAGADREKGQSRIAGLRPKSLLTDLIRLYPSKALARDTACSLTLMPSSTKLAV